MNVMIGIRGENGSGKSGYLKYPEPYHISGFLKIKTPVSLSYIRYGSIRVFKIYGTIWYGSVQVFENLCNK